MRKDVEAFEREQAERFDRFVAFLDRPEMANLASKLEGLYERDAPVAERLELLGTLLSVFRTITSEVRNEAHKRAT